MSNNKLIYIIFNKPYGVLCQFTGESGDRTLAEFGLPKDVYAAGRLDKDSEGLLLLTNDGKFIDKLLNPRFDHQKCYWAQIEKVPTKEDLDKLARGVDIKGYKTKPCKVKILDPAPEIPDRDPPIRFRKSIPTCWIELILTEGKNRQVRRMTAAIGFPTLRLIRVGIGKQSLADLKEGQWKEVSREMIL